MMATIEKEQATEPEFVLSRTFDARRERVWRAFTDSEAMRHWWGHAGAKVIAGRMDLRVGGTYVYGLQTPGQPEMWGRFTYREIAAPEKLVAENCFSDPQGGVSRHPLSPSWPLHLLTTLIFTEEDGWTTLTVKWSPIDPTSEERETFVRHLGDCKQGWTGTLNQLEAYLASAKSA